MNGRTIALTGATGFVGRHLLLGLLATGYTVIALHRRNTTAELIQHARLTWSPLSQAAAMFARHRINATCHLATSYGTGTALAEVVTSNIVMPLQLLELAIGHGCPLFVSTDSFFAKAALDYPHMRPYIESKGQFLGWAKLAASSAPTVKVVNARLEHVYGTGDGPQKFVPHVLSKLLANELLKLTPGDQRRDFIHVTDVVTAYLAILESADLLPRGLSEVQVGTGESHTVRDFVETARSLSGSSSFLEFGAHPHREREIMRSEADTARLRTLGWRPSHSLASGIGEVLDARPPSRSTASAAIQTPGRAR